MLLSVTPDFSLYCLNSGLPTHYHRSTDSFSCIDLSSCSSVALDFIWSYLSSFFGSDHYPILLSEVHSSPLPSCNSRWNFDRTNWSRFSQATEISTPLSSFASVDTALAFFNGLILDAANNFIRLFLPRVKSASHGELPSVLPSLEPKSGSTGIGYGCGPE